MARLKLEDFDGVINITLFPNVFYQSFNVAFPDEIVVVEGRVDTSADPIQILADRIISAETYVADFWLVIPEQLDKPSTFADLKKIFDEHAGLSQVFLNRDGKWRKINKKISDSLLLRDELKKLLSAENVRVY